ncbi:prostatic acid phosphatase-like protein [Dinothrombium tinctorium]|uniref:Prostatic acid phosphatase-like protein n=1 Tax=Dinothrombium tinctorium TaxID=1965070 RepID=A0A3S3QGM4_9ACAR|nr:prostatic acid phosphatase-like protein [Dinothrombium tinctorium]
MSKFAFPIICFLFFLTTNKCDHLKSVVVIHRHGDRTPTSPYENDPYRNNSFWPDGWGQLTSV